MPRANTEQVVCSVAKHARLTPEPPWNPLVVANALLATGTCTLLGRWPTQCNDEPVHTLYRSPSTSEGIRTMLSMLSDESLYE